MPCAIMFKTQDSKVEVVCDPSRVRLVKENKAYIIEDCSQHDSFYSINIGKLTWEEVIKRYVYALGSEPDTNCYFIALFED